MLLGIILVIVFLWLLSRYPEIFGLMAVFVGLIILFAICR